MSRLRRNGYQHLLNLNWVVINHVVQEKPSVDVTGHPGRTFRVSPNSRINHHMTELYFNVEVHTADHFTVRRVYQLRDPLEPTNHRRVHALSLNATRMPQRNWVGTASHCRQARACDGARRFRGAGLWSHRCGVSPLLWIVMV
jgi:hypothetical protein